MGKDFLKGLTRVLDIGLTMKNHKEVKNILSKDDYQALTSDWEAIGRDMKKFWG
jgi:hypothetical protein